MIGNVEMEIVRYTISTEVTHIEEEFQPCYISGFGKDAIFESRSRGWFLYLKGSYEALFLGREEPTLKKGDKIKVTIEKEDSNG